MAKYAVIVVDMLDDFVNGALACERCKEIVPALAALCDAARAKNVPVIFSNDAHIKGVDKELKLWGDHALAGTPGANVTSELHADTARDFILPKRHYSGFFGTDLNLLLKDLGVDTCIITGVHTHICCVHTAADAYQYGYDVVLPDDTTTAFTENDYINGMKYIKEMYGARICKSSEVAAEF
ncbi:MAG: isochorismatase family cysteine hydrolase [Synergistes sp.]|nr:isochorismatase family cysteine hydrolase [Synergistes sp.]